MISFISMLSTGKVLSTAFVRNKSPYQPSWCNLLPVTYWPFLLLFFNIATLFQSYALLMDPEYRLLTLSEAFINELFVELYSLTRINEKFFLHYLQINDLLLYYKFSHFFLWVPILQCQTSLPDLFHILWLYIIWLYKLTGFSAWWIRVFLLRMRDFP